MMREMTTDGVVEEAVILRYSFFISCFIPNFIFKLLEMGVQFRKIRHGKDHG